MSGIVILRGECLGDDVIAIVDDELWDQVLELSQRPNKEADCVREIITWLVHPDENPFDPTYPERKGKVLDLWFPDAYHAEGAAFVANIRGFLMVPYA